LKRLEINMSEATKAKVDKFLNKWLSRKLIVFAVACLGLFSDHLTGEEWIIISTAYISLEGFADIVARIKNT